MPQSTCGGQRKTLWNHFSTPILSGVPGIDRSCQALVAKAFSCRDILPALKSNILGVNLKTCDMVPTTYFSPKFSVVYKQNVLETTAL